MVKLKKMHILIVGCESPGDIAFENSLTKLGYAVSHLTASVGEIFKKVRRQMPDLVVLSILRQDDMDGINVAASIMGQLGIPVVFFTDSKGLQRLNQSDLTCFYGYIPTDFDEAGLAVTIRMALKSAKAEAGWRDRHENEQQSLLESLLNETGAIAKVGGWEMNPVTGEVRLTRQIYRILEVPGDYKPYFGGTLEFLHPEDKESFKNALDRALGHGEPFDLVRRIITAKGNHLWMRAVCMPEFEDGRVVRLKGIYQDITELKNAEKALMESEHKYRSVIEMSPLGIGMTDTAGRIITVNRSFAAMLGYTSEELLELDFTDITHPDDVHGELELFQAVVNGDIDSYSFEKRYKHRDGNYFWISLTTAKITLSGAQTLIYAFVENISERKQMEQNREQLIQELQDALNKVNVLSGLIPICAGCKKIRDDQGYWNQLETYIQKHSDTSFSHGLCPECSEKLYGGQAWYTKMKEKKKKN